LQVTITCVGSTNVYSVTSAVGHTYNWSVTGGTISGSANSNAVNIVWGTGTSGTVTVTQTNASGCDSTVSRIITLMPKPTPVVTGPNSLCRLTAGTYSIVPTAGNSYSWSVLGGSINGSSTSTSITVSWGNYSSGTVTLTETNMWGCDSTITINVTLNPFPVPVISGSLSVCQLTTSTYSVANVPGNTYAWSVTGGTFTGSSTTNTVNISWSTSAQGTVIVTQTNSFGCDSTVTRNITLLANPVPVINGNTNVCAGSTTSFSVPSASGNLFAWTVTGGAISGNPNANAINVVWGTGSSGTVTVTQTNASGCDSTVSVNINIIALPVVSITAPTDACLDMPSQFSINLSAGENAVWSVTGGTIIGPNNMPTSDIAWTTGGMHTITAVVTNSTTGCSTTVTTNMIVELPPAPVISGLDPVCELDTAQYSVAFMPGHMYIWNVIGGSIVSFNISNTIDVLWWAAGTGSVSCKQISPAGCDSTVYKSVIINNQPLPIINGNIYVCAHSSETYFVNASAGSSYTWSVTGGTINGTSNGSTVNVTWDVTGMGSVTVVETNGSGCAEYSTMTITIQDAPAPAITGSALGCVTPVPTNYSTPWTINSAFTWTVTGGAVVSGHGTNSVNVAWNTIGMNTITLTVINTLTGCDSSVTLNVDVMAIVPPTVQASITSGCPPLTVMFSGNNTMAGQTYFWDFGDNLTSTGSNPTHIYTQSGTFTIRVITTNVNGCSDTAYGQVIVRPVPNASFTHNFINDFHYIPESMLSLNNTSTGGTSFMWTFGTGDTSVAFEPPYVYTHPDDYIIHLYVTNQWGCKDSAQLGIRVRVREGIYIPNAFSPNGDGINEYFFVDGQNITNLKMFIFDRWGELLVETDNKNFKWDGTYKGDVCQEGVYIYYVTTKGANGTENEFKGTITLVK
jgi:gliding motility-associated-like protein